VLLDQLLELFRDALALEGRTFFAVDIDRRDRTLARAGQADADVRVLALAGSVDDAPHHGNRHFLDALVLLAPLRHLIANVTLNLLGKLLKIRRRRAPTPRACDDHRHERAQT